MADPAESTTLRRYAMDLLARREHSRLELEEKLRRHCGKAARAQAQDGRGRAGQADEEIRSEGDPAESPGHDDPSAVETLIANTLDVLAEDGLQSDRRYAEVLIRSRVNRGQGPLRIRADLRQRGLDGAAIEPLLEDYAEQWSDLAQQVVERRFGTEAAVDRREWARRARFLASRGFPDSLVGRVLGPLP